MSLRRALSSASTGRWLQQCGLVAPCRLVGSRNHGRYFSEESGEAAQIKRNQELIQSAVSRYRREFRKLPKFILPEDYGPPHENRVGSLPLVYSTATMLHEVAEEDVGKWYLNRKQDIEKIPDSLRHTTEDLFEACLCEYLMIRQPTYDVLQALKEIQTGAAENASGKSVAFHGPRGTGKSVSLNLLAQYAAQNDWLIVGTRGEDLVSDKFGFITPSTTREGIYNQDRYAREWCRKLLNEQGAKLRKIKLKRSYSYTWKSPPIGSEAKGLSCEEEGKTMHDLCTQTLIDTTTGASVVYDIMEELKLMTPKEGKVLILMDNINVWDQKSRFRDPENPFKCIDPFRLSMVDAFSTFIRQGPATGMSAWAITCAGYATLTKSRLHISEATYEICSSIYDDDELMTAVAHFKASKILTSEVDPFLMARIKGLTGAVPKDVLFDAVLV